MMSNGVGGAVGPGESLRTLKWWLLALMATAQRSFQAGAGGAGMAGVLMMMGPCVVVPTPMGPVGGGKGLGTPGTPEAIGCCSWRWPSSLAGVTWCPQSVHGEDGSDRGPMCVPPPPLALPLSLKSSWQPEWASGDESDTPHNVPDRLRDGECYERT